MMSRVLERHDPRRRYRILGRLGRGGMDTLRRRTPAPTAGGLKVLHPRLAEDGRFVRGSSKRLARPRGFASHVVEIRTSEHPDGSVYFVIEHLRGHT